MPRKIALWGSVGLLAAVLAGPSLAAQPAAPPKPPAQGAPAPGQKKDEKAKESPAAVEVRLSDQLLLEMEKKRRELDQRETELKREEGRLQELRADIKKRMDALREIEARIQKAIEKTTPAKDDRLDHLVRAYSAMAPDAAATLMNTLDITLAVQILRNMQVKRAGAILAVVQPERAAKISELLARAKAP